MKTTQYLDAAKRALGIESDYALAKHLELTKQAISHLRNRGDVMNNTTAARIAHIIGADALKVIADCELERGSSPEFWKRLRDAAVIATMALGAASFGVLPGDCYASSGRFNNTFFAVTSTPLAPAAPTTSHNATEVHIVRRLRRAAAAAIAFLVGLVGLVL